MYELKLKNPISEVCDIKLAKITIYIQKLIQDIPLYYTIPCFFPNQIMCPPPPNLPFFGVLPLDPKISPFFQIVLHYDTSTSYQVLRVLMYLLAHET